MGKTVLRHTVSLNGSEQTGYEVFDSRKVSVAQFCQLYTSSMIANMRLTSAEYVVLMYALERSLIYPSDSKEIGSRVIIDRELKSEICAKTGYHMNSLEHAIKTLTTKGLLLKSDFRGKYFLNPEYFFKGAINDRIKVVHLICELER